MTWFWIIAAVLVFLALQHIEKMISTMLEKIEELEIHLSDVENTINQISDRVVGEEDIV